jgi:arsenate reductase (thioredoxin)
MSATYNILFLCTGNSARSILAEALATTLSHGRFIGFSAGSKPAGTVNPIALKLVGQMGYPLELVRSKSWDELGRDGSPHMDFIITLCDSAAGEECPYWIGHPATAHWGFPDPVAVQGSEEEKLAAFKSVEIGLRNRIELLLDLSPEQLNHLEVKERLAKIHHGFQFS